MIIIQDNIPIIKGTNITVSKVLHQLHDNKKSCKDICKELEISKEDIFNCINFYINNALPPNINIIESISITKGGEEWLQI